MSQQFTLEIETGLESRPVIKSFIRDQNEALERARKLTPIGLQKSVKVISPAGELIYARNLKLAPHSFTDEVY